ncbi:hypothetical protein T439DRAFT_376152 [Meredithblackwellia eburnea MCA 4105]
MSKQNITNNNSKQGFSPSFMQPELDLTVGEAGGSDRTRAGHDDFEEEIERNKASTSTQIFKQRDQHPKFAPLNSFAPVASNSTNSKNHRQSTSKRPLIPLGSLLAPGAGASSSSHAGKGKGKAEEASASRPKKPATNNLMISPSGLGFATPPKKVQLTAPSSALRPLGSLLPPVSASKKSGTSSSLASPAPPPHHSPPAKKKPKLQPLATPPKPPSKPKASSSPAKPLLDSPPSARAAALFNGLPPGVFSNVSSKNIQNTGEETIVSGRRLLDSVPKPPNLPVWFSGEGEDGGDDGSGAYVDWSPKKKSSKYLTGGLASLAINVLSSQRTQQTIWRSSLCRKVEPHQGRHATSSPLSYSQLFKLTVPEVRLVVLETLPLPFTLRAKEKGEVRHWEESRTLLARCRLVLDEDEPGFKEEEEDTKEEDLEGLVLFSLQHNDTSRAASMSRTSVPSAPPAFIKSPPAKSRRSSTSPENEEDDQEGRSFALFLPEHGHDLSYICAGREVWVWDPFTEISLLAPDQRAFWSKRVEQPVLRVQDNSLQGESRVIAGEETESQVKGEDGDVFWDPRPVEEIERERLEEERLERAKAEERKALVCGRFGLVG